MSNADPPAGGPGNAVTTTIATFVVKPKAFGGSTTEDIVTWIQDYCYAADSNGWTEAMKIQKLSGFLTGPARDWYALDIDPGDRPVT